MALAINWNPSSPNGATDDIRNGDNEIVTFKGAFVERIRQGGHVWETVAGPSTTAQAGRHATGVEFAAGGSGAADFEFYVYDKAGTTKVITIKDAGHATPGLALNTGLLTIPKLEITGGASTVTGAMTWNGLQTLAAGLTVNAGAVTINPANQVVSLNPSGTGYVALSSNTKVDGGTLLISRPWGVNVTSIVAGTTTLAAGDNFVLADSTAGTVTVNLSAGLLTAGAHFVYIKKTVSAGAVTINAPPAGTIIGPTGGVASRSSTAGFTTGFLYLIQAVTAYEISAG